jgi:hypothetical protein
MPKYGEIEYGSSYEYGSAPAIPPVIGSTSSGIGHRVNVHQVDVVFAGRGSGAIQGAKKRNQFDELGDLVSLPRLQDETNWEYRRRIQDSLVHYANASYRGMVYGITHELGLAVYPSIIINPKTDGDGNFLAPDPYVRFDGPYVYLYSDYANGMLDWAIDRFEAGGNYEHVGRLIEMINNTSFFEAERPADIDYYDRSMTILNQSNRGVVSFERLPASDKFKLQHDHVVRGSLFFSNRDQFRTEVTSEDAVVSPGQYYVDYTSGLVKVFTIPGNSDIVRYQYIEYPFRAVASPVIVHDVTNENFRTKMFQQIQLDNGTYTHGKPTEMGVDIINELLTIVPMYWGI